MKKFIAMKYKEIKPQRYSKEIVERALTEIKEEQENPVEGIPSSESLNVVLAHVKYMIQYDVVLWGVEITTILKKLEEMYGIENIVEALNSKK